MKRYTLLEVAQEVARCISADEITALDESIESVDIAATAVTTLNDILGRNAWEFLSDRVIPLTSVNGFVFDLPEDVTEILEVYATGAGTDVDVVVPYAMPQYFTRRAALNATGTVVSIPKTGTLKLQPTGIPVRYTTYDELSIVLLNNAPANIIKIRARTALDLTPAGNRIDGFADAWVPEIPLRMFNYWVYETCAVSSALFRQVVDQRMEGMAQRAYEALVGQPPVTRLETNQRRLSRLMDARINAAQQQGQQQGGNQQGGGQ